MGFPGLKVALPFPASTGAPVSAHGPSLHPHVSSELWGFSHPTSLWHWLSNLLSLVRSSAITTDPLISHASKIMLRILQARLQQYMNCEFPDVPDGFRKGRGTEIKLPTSVGSLKKWESSRKPYISALLTMPKPLTMWITAIYGKFLKRWEYQTTIPASWEICKQVKKQQLELDMEQWSGSKLRKEYVKAVYCHPAYLTSMKSTSWKTLGWMKHKLEKFNRKSSEDNWNSWRKLCVRDRHWESLYSKSKGK